MWVRCSILRPYGEQPAMGRGNCEVYVKHGRPTYLKWHVTLQGSGLQDAWDKPMYLVREELVI